MKLPLIKISSQLQLLIQEVSQTLNFISLEALPGNDYKLVWIQGKQQHSLPNVTDSEEMCEI